MCASVQYVWPLSGKLMREVFFFSCWCAVPQQGGTDVRMCRRDVWLCRAGRTILSPLPSNPGHVLPAKILLPAIARLCGHRGLTSSQPQQLCGADSRVVAPLSPGGPQRLPVTARCRVLLPTRGMHQRGTKAHESARIHIIRLHTNRKRHRTDKIWHLCQFLSSIRET